MVIIALAGACVSPYTRAVTQLPGLVLSAPLDETAGLVAHDHGPRGNDGTISPWGVTYQVDDPLSGNPAERRALRLASNLGSITFPHDDALNLSTDPGTQWTAMIDVKVNARSGYPLLLSKGDRSTNGFAIFADPSLNAVGYIVDGHQYAWDGVSLLETTQLAVDWDGKALHLFANGVQVGQFNAGAQSISDHGPLRVGAAGGVTVSKVAITDRSAAASLPSIFAALGQETSSRPDGNGNGTTSTSASPTTTNAPPTTTNPWPTTTTAAPTTKTPSSVGNVLWSDEFNGPAGAGVNPSAWEQQDWAAGNGELKYYTPGTRNVAQDGQGNLVITARREDYGGRQYTSGRIESNASFTTGYLEFRAKLPTWVGSAPALWTYGANGYGPVTQYSELDAVELQTGGTYADPTNVRQTVHGQLGNGIWQLGWSQNRVNFAPNLPGDAWHTFGVYVSPTDQSVTFYTDGVVQARYAKGQQPGGGAWPYGVYAQKIILNVTMGFYSGTPSNNRSSDTMQVDYVRVYDRPPY